MAGLRPLSLLLCLFLLGSCPFTWAAVEHRFSGFATLGLVSNANDELAFRREITQDDGAYAGALEWQTDSLLGVQWQSRWSQQFDTTLQLVAKERYDNSAENAVEWAFVRYRPVDGLDLRLGRLGTDIFMLSDYRQVGYAFPWVRPPHEFYTLLSIFHFDGVDLNKRFDWGERQLNLKLFYGNSDQKYPTGLRSAVFTRLDFDLAGLSAVFEQGYWKWRYSYANININNNATAALVNSLNAAQPLWPQAGDLAALAATEQRDFRYHELGATYDNNRWWLQAEATQLRSQTSIVPQSDHSYLSIGRRFEPFSLYLLAGLAEPRRGTIAVMAPSGYPSPIAEQLAQLAFFTQLNLNGVRIRQKSIGLGLRWDFAAKMALKFQLEEFHIGQQGTNLWLSTDSTGDLAGDQRATVTSLSLDLLF